MLTENFRSLPGAGQEFPRAHFPHAVPFVLGDFD